MPYGYVAVSKRPQVEEVAYSDVIWTVFSAFTPSCWGVMAAAVVLSGLAHALFEHRGRLNDSGAPVGAQVAATVGKNSGKASGGKKGEDGVSSNEEGEDEDAPMTAMGSIGMSLFHSTVR